MFSSLASFIFGTNISATPISEENKNNQSNDNLAEAEQALDYRELETEDTIDVTSSTPSVTGAGSNNGVRQGKRVKNKRNKNNTKKEVKKDISLSITKLLIPNENFDQELDEDDWFIVSREEEEESLPYTDSEDEISVAEIKAQPLDGLDVAQDSGNQRRRRYINSNSLYSGPRPQQYRNFLHRTRNSGGRGSSASVPALSPSRCVTDGDVAVVSNGSIGIGVTQSLCIVASSNDERSDNETSSIENGANPFMEESWFVTPPPCFTSIGPIHMETSPFENLLIEHPSMSVYHSIRSAQEATESFVNLDLGVKESQKRNDPLPVARRSGKPPVEEHNARTSQSFVQQANSSHVDRSTIIQLKQDVLARNSQKNYEKKKRQNLCRGAIKRSNQVRDYQSKANRPRRSDMQHCKIVSGANNNRKCCF